jgi:hypothetical protein
VPAVFDTGVLSAARRGSGHDELTDFDEHHPFEQGTHSESTIACIA